MNIPEIEMRVLTESGIVTKPITFQEAIEQRDLGYIERDGFASYFEYKFEWDYYLEKLTQTRFAEAWVTLHKGLNGTYEEARDGSVFWETEDVNWFETQILGL